MKSILFIIHSMPIGGAEKVLVDYLDQFDYNNYSIDLLLYTGEGDLLSVINKNVRVLSMHPHNSSFISTWIRRIYKLFNVSDYYEKRIINKITRNRYDTIISFCQGLAHKIHSLILDRSDNNISWIHSDLTVSNWGVLYFDNSLQKQQKAYNSMSKLVFVSNQAKKTFNQLFSIDAKIEQHTIYNIINEPLIKEKSLEPLGVTKKVFTFINIGRLIEAKRQDRLINAATVLRKKGYDFEIWIIGDGPLRKKLEAMVIDNSLQENVKILGLKSNPYPYLAKADCFVLTSQQEGFAIVLGEAFALSKPVISTKITGPSEILNDNRYGLIVEQDVDEIAKAMETMMFDDEIRMHYSKIGQERLSDFAPKRIIEQLYSIL